VWPAAVLPSEREPLFSGHACQLCAQPGCSKKGRCSPAAPLEQYPYRSSSGARRNGWTGGWFSLGLLGLLQPLSTCPAPCCTVWLLT
jgi:hypothetical protein